MRTLNGDGARAKSRDEQLRAIIDGMTAKTLKKDKARALALLNGTEKKQ